MWSCTILVLYRKLLRTPLLGTIIAGNLKEDNQMSVLLILGLIIWILVLLFPKNIQFISMGGRTVGENWNPVLQRVFVLISGPVAGVILVGVGWLLVFLGKAIWAPILALTRWDMPFLK